MTNPNHDYPEYSHFTDRELRCPCCGGLPPADRLASLRDKLERLRSLARAPIVINSAYRCPAKNKAVGGAIHSRHMVGDAADVRAIGVRLEELMSICNSDPLLSAGGLAISVSRGFLHIDCGPKRRWEYT